MISIDLNCDLGEGFSNDAALMPYISSANIACTFHAGDIDTMTTTIRLAKRNNVAIGAHPGFADKNNFGRIPLELSPSEIYNLITVQLNLMQQVCTTEVAILHHVKPHGALYNMAAKDAAVAQAIATAVYTFDRGLILYGLSGSQLIKEAKKIGLTTASEVFADRTYQDDGSLTPRSDPGASITETSDCVQQVLQMIKGQQVFSENGTYVPIVAETICLHGDGENAVEFAREISQALKQEHIEIRAHKKAHDQ